MSEQDSGRKTLTIKNREKTATSGAADDKKRTRIGSRARQVVNLKRGKDQTARRSGLETPDTEGRDRPARSGRGDFAPRDFAPRGGSRDEQRPARPDSRRSASDGDRRPSGTGSARTGSQDPRRTTRQPSERRPSSKDLPARRARPASPSHALPSSPQLHPLHAANYDPEITGSSWDDLLEDEAHVITTQPEQNEDFRHEHREEREDRHSTFQSHKPRLIHDAEIFPVFAPCPVGLEEALGAELAALGFEQVHTTRAGCHFEADWWGVQRANLYSRLATRILVQLGHAPCSREDDILELSHSIEWERWFGPEHTLRVDTSAVRSPMQSLQYCNLRAKDGICDRLREREGARPSIDTVRPDARVHLFLSADTATLYLDTSGESLFKRGWRLDKGEAPLRENLAAGMLALSGWDPSAALLDPFCGSGTILIEAAWIAMGVPPGITRPFGFERLRDHDPRRWSDLKAEAQEHILPGLEAPIVGIDANPDAIEAAQRNAERAYLTEDTIQFEVGDARDAVAPAPSGWIVTNPPYGERMDPYAEGIVGAEDIEFWREWSSNLKKEFTGWQVNVITSDLDLPKHMRLKANRRTPLFNGALDCRLFNFELVESTYRDK